MPAPVDGTQAASAIAALVRQALGAKLLQRTTQTRDSKKTSARSVPSGSPRPSTAHAPLPDLIATRVEELNPDAPDFRSRVLRLVVEASLLQAFGHHLINAPRFQGMVDSVWRDLESAPQLQQDIRAVMESLARGQAPSAKPSPA